MDRVVSDQREGPMDTRSTLQMLADILGCCEWLEDFRA